jgi:hypothetical protein
MTIHIPVSELEPQAKKLYLEGKLTELGIDYQYNWVDAWDGEKDIVVFKFKKYFKADNKFCTYKIHQNKSELIIEMTLPI